MAYDPDLLRLAITSMRSARAEIDRASAQLQRCLSTPPPEVVPPWLESHAAPPPGENFELFRDALHPACTNDSRPAMSTHIAEGVIRHAASPGGCMRLTFKPITWLAYYAALEFEIRAMGAIPQDAIAIEFGNGVDMRAHRVPLNQCGVNIFKDGWTACRLEVDEASIDCWGGMFRSVSFVNQTARPLPVFELRSLSLLAR